MQYDWTDPVPQNMPDDEKQVYYKLRRLSRKTDNPHIWPDGRIWSEEEIIAALDGGTPVKKSAAAGDILPPRGEFEE